MCPSGVFTRIPYYEYILDLHFCSNKQTIETRSLDSSCVRSRMCTFERHVCEWIYVIYLQLCLAAVSVRPFLRASVPQCIGVLTRCCTVQQCVGTPVHWRADARRGGCTSASGSLVGALRSTREFTYLISSSAKRRHRILVLIDTTVYSRGYPT
jgi:hypothetical protein